MIQSSEACSWTNNGILHANHQLLQVRTKAEATDAGPQLETTGAYPALIIIIGKSTDMHTLLTHNEPCHIISGLKDL